MHNTNLTQQIKNDREKENKKNKRSADICDHIK
jgi:hypothetical protein